MICALRDSFPQAFIAWAVESPADQFIAHHKAIDQVFVLRRGWLKRPGDILRLRRELRALKFDISIDPQSRTKSAMIARLSGAPRRIGWQHPEGKDVALWLNNDRQPVSKPHVVDRQLDLLKPLGIENPVKRFEFPLQSNAVSTVLDFLNKVRLVRGNMGSRGFVAINPGAGWHSRQWPPQRYGLVAQYLHDTFSLQSVVTWAGKAELFLARTVVSRSKGTAILAPSTNLGELAALLQRAEFYLGSDTGPMHFSAAVNTPCVGLFGPTRPACSGPYGPHHIPVQAYYQFARGYTRRYGNNRAMQAITTEMVCQACNQMVTLTNTKNFQHAVA